MKYILHNQKGEKIGETLLPKEIFGQKVNPDLIHQVAVSQLANRRQVLAHAKGRGEVRGGGRKPWRQKGTGRARVGSRRSPLWRGGGITFGPTKERNFKRIIPKKMRRKALFMVLSQKVKDNELLILDELKLDKPKTKVMRDIVNSQLSTFNSQNKSVLIALPKMGEDVILGARNLPRVATIPARDLNCLDILSYKYLMLTKESIKVIKETFKSI